MEHGVVATVRRSHRYVRKRSGGLPRIAVEGAALEQKVGRLLATRVLGVLVPHLSRSLLARLVSLRRPGGGLHSPGPLCLDGGRHRLGTTRTALYEGGTARLSHVV